MGDSWKPKWPPTYTARSVMATEYTLSKWRETHSGWTLSLPATGKAMAVSLIGGRSPPEPLPTTKYWSLGAMSPA